MVGALCLRTTTVVTMFWLFSVPILVWKRREKPWQSSHMMVLSCGFHWLSTKAPVPLTLLTFHLIIRYVSSHYVNEQLFYSITYFLFFSWNFTLSSMQVGLMSFYYWWFVFTIFLTVTCNV